MGISVVGVVVRNKSSQTRIRTQVSRYRALRATVTLPETNSDKESWLGLQVFRESPPYRP